MLDLALALRDLVEEVLGDQRDVVGALAQRRQVDREYVEAIEQVFAQLAGADRLHRVAVGRGQDADIGLLHLGRPDPHEGAGLEHAQQLDLQVERHLGDLVQKERAAAGSLEEADVLAVGAGEAPLLVAEDLAFDQVRRDRAAVDREERAGAPPAQVVHGLRDDFLAGAALAGDEHRHRGARDAQDLLIDPAHRGRAAPELAEMALFLQALLEVVGLGLQCRRLGQPGQHALELLQAHRLDEVVGGAQAQRLDGCVQARVARDQHHLGVRQHLRVVEQLHAAAVGQYQVEQHDVGLLQRHLAPRVAQRAGGRDGEPLVRDQHGHRLGRIGIVVNDQRVRHASLSWYFSTTTPPTQMPAPFSPTRGRNPP